MRLFQNLTPPLIPTYGPATNGDALSHAGGVFMVNGNPCNGHYIFVVLPSNNPFAAFTDHNGDGITVRVSQNNHHDDLAMGNVVYYAGTVDFANGVITEWSNHSGHYQPQAIYRDQAPTVFPGGIFRVVLNDGTLAP